MEAVHDFIQWEFPLHEKSYHAKVSPVLTPKDVEALRKSEIAQHNMRISFSRFCGFLGLAPMDDDRIRWWANDGNHNLLRITRVIRSLRLFGFEEEAGLFFDAVVEIGKDMGLKTTPYSYWKRALEENVWTSQTDKFLEMKRIEL